MRLRLNASPRPGRATRPRRGAAGRADRRPIVSRGRRPPARVPVRRLPDRAPRLRRRPDHARRRPPGRRQGLRATRPHLGLQDGSRRQRADPTDRRPGHAGDGPGRGRERHPDRRLERLSDLPGPAARCIAMPGATGTVSKVASQYWARPGPLRAQPGPGRRLHDRRRRQPAHRRLVDDPGRGLDAGNAWKYGWVMSFPKGKRSITCFHYEPWHYRYVGREVAREIHESGLTIREYLWAQLHPGRSPSRHR